VNLLGKKRFGTEYLLIGALLISCLYVWPLKIIWIDNFVITNVLIMALLKIKKENLELKKIK
jgi:hypothetical protein